MPKILLLGMALFALSAGALAADAVPVAKTPTVVEIHNMRFIPAMLTVAVGTKVTWVNEDAAPHTVTDKADQFHSELLERKGTFSFTFASPGEFTYFCTIHPTMVGKIVVRPAGSSS
jgi:plastocyanin